MPSLADMMGQGGPYNKYAQKEGSLVGNFFSDAARTVGGILPGVAMLGKSAIGDVGRAAGIVDGPMQLDDVGRGLANYYKNDSPWGSLLKGDFREAGIKAHRNPFSTGLDVLGGAGAAAKGVKSATISAAKMGSPTAAKALDKSRFFKMTKMDFGPLDDVDDALHARAGFFDFDPSTGSVAKAKPGSIRGTLPYRGVAEKIGDDYFVRGTHRLVSPAKTDRYLGANVNRVDQTGLGGFDDARMVDAVGQSGAYKRMNPNPVGSGIGDILEDARAKVPGNVPLLGNDNRINRLTEKHWGKYHMELASEMMRLNEKSQSDAMRFSNTDENLLRLVGGDVEKAQKITTYALQRGIARGKINTKQMKWADNEIANGTALDRAKQHYRKLKWDVEAAKASGAKMDDIQSALYELENSKDWVESLGKEIERLDFKKAGAHGRSNAYAFLNENEDAIQYVMDSPMAQQWYDNMNIVSRATQRLYRKNRGLMWDDIDVRRSEWNSIREEFGVLDEDTLNHLDEAVQRGNLRKPLQFSRSQTGKTPDRAHAGQPMSTGLNKRTASSSKHSAGYMAAQDLGINYYNPQSLDNIFKNYLEQLTEHTNNRRAQDSMRSVISTSPIDATEMRRKGLLGYDGDSSGSPYVYADDLLRERANLEHVNTLMHSTGDDVMIHTIADELKEFGYSDELAKAEAKARVAGFKDEVMQAARSEEKFTKFMADDRASALYEMIRKSKENKALLELDAAAAGNPKNLPSALKKHREALREIGPPGAYSREALEESLRILDDAVKEFGDAGDKHRRVPIMTRKDAEALKKATRSGLEEFNTLFDEASYWWKMTVLPMRPKWYVNNAAGMWMLYALKHGSPKAIKSAYKYYKSMWQNSKSKTGLVERLKSHGDISDESVVLDRAGTATGERMLLSQIDDADDITHADDAARSQYGTSHTGGTTAVREQGSRIAETKATVAKRAHLNEGKIARFVRAARERFNDAFDVNASVADDPARHSAVIDSLQDNTRRVRELIESDLDLAKAIAGMSDEQLAVYLSSSDDFRMMVIDDVFSDMIDFRDLNVLERKYVARLFPFYSWVKGAFKVGSNAPLKHPSRSLGWAQVGHYGADKVEEHFGDYIPGYFGEYIPIGDSFSGEYISTSGMNPLMSTVDAAAALGQLLPVPNKWTYGSESITGMVNPFIKEPISVAMQKDPFTGQHLGGRIDPDASWFERWGKSGPGALVPYRLVDTNPQWKLARQLFSEDMRNYGTPPSSYLMNYLGVPFPRSVGAYDDRVNAERERAKPYE